MATRQQITKLAERIEQLATRYVSSGAPIEHWGVEGNTAYQLGEPGHVITFAELEADAKARPATRRIVSRIVHAQDGRPAPCCLPGGECYALHGPPTNHAA